MLHVAQGLLSETDTMRRSRGVKQKGEWERVRGEKRAPKTITSLSKRRARYGANFGGSNLEQGEGPLSGLQLRTRMKERGLKAGSEKKGTV